MIVDKKRIIANIIRVPLLRNILIACLAIAVIFPLYSVLFVYPSFIDRLIKSTEDDAVSTARHLTRMIIPADSELKGDYLSPDTIRSIGALTNDFNLERLRIFLQTGKIIYSSNPEDIGKINEEKYFHEIVTRGDVYTNVVQKDTASLEGRVLRSDVVETYVPLIRNNRFSGAFEIYYDITEKREKLDNLLSQSSTILYGIAASLLVAVMIILFQAGKTIIERSEAEEALRLAHMKLEQRVEERTAELAEANAQLRRQIAERQEVERALRESGERLHVLSSHLLTAQERERRRISLELHDELGQSLTVLKLQLRSLKENFIGDQQALHTGCESTLQYVDQIIENVRRLSRDLSPAILEDLGLTAALRWLVQDFGNHSDLETILELPDIDILLSGDAQITIYRIFQEALSNIGKHAQAKRVWAVIEKRENRIDFRIEDDGTGFDIDQVDARYPTEKSLGLVAMDERARMLGGSLQIDSRLGAGTKITFAIPVHL